MTSGLLSYLLGAELFLWESGLSSSGSLASGLVGGLFFTGQEPELELPGAEQELNQARVVVQAWVSGCLILSARNWEIKT